jgi:hypothetical protein
MTPKRQFELKLGYPLAPIPKWIVAEWCAGRMSGEAFDLHVVLYEKAISRKLMQRLPTPRMLRTELSKQLRRPDDAAFAKLLQRERNRGRLDYVVEGNATTGYVYVFMLYPDGPSLSEFGPTSDATAGLTSNGDADGAASGIADSERDGVSDQENVLESTTGPTSDPACPTTNGTADPVPERDSDDVEDAACPTSQDVRENPNRRRVEDLLGRASGDHDRQVGGEDSANHDERASSNGRTTTPTGLTVPVEAVAQRVVESDDSPASTPLLDLFRETAS